MRKVTVSQAVKQSIGQHKVRLAFTPCSVYLVCLDNEGLVVNSFRLADRCSSYVSKKERREWADKVLAAYLKFKIRYELEWVGVNSWRVARVHDGKRIGGICKDGTWYICYHDEAIPRHRFRTLKEAFNFIVDGGLTK